MAKAKFHKSQRVFVKPVGTWAHVEAVVPTWVKGSTEPSKITYDCGMGREFEQEELEEESLALQSNAANGVGSGASCEATTAGRVPNNAGITRTPAPTPPERPPSRIAVTAVRWLNRPDRPATSDVVAYRRQASGSRSGGWRRRPA